MIATATRGTTKRVSRKTSYRAACSRLYRRDPAAYAADVLGVSLTPKQEEIACSLLEKPHKTLVRSGNKTGKSKTAAICSSWWYDTRDPSFCLTTAPNEKQVKSIIWKELRDLRRHLGGFPGPEACVLKDSPHHFAFGVVARTPEGFQGQHGAAALIIIDEAVGVAEPFWGAAESMLGGDEYALLAIFNPTDVSSYAYLAEQSGAWRVIEMSQLDHPNITAELQGLPPPVPNAIRLERVTAMLEEWSAPVSGTPEPGDVEWPPGSGRWLRPGMEACARCLGIWPLTSSESVWSEYAWRMCEKPAPQEAVDAGSLEIGCDVARFGDDATAVLTRKGPTALDHTRRVKQDTVQTANLCIDHAEKWGKACGTDPRKVPVKVDDSGVGGGVTDVLRSRGYRAVPVLAASRANRQALYPNRRSELWFDTADEAKAARLDLTRLPPATRAELKRQVMGVKWKLNAAGQRVVEDKAITKERLKRSPDDADALNLCYGKAPRFEASIIQ